MSVEPTQLNVEQLERAAATHLTRAAIRDAHSARAANAANVYHRAITLASRVCESSNIVHSSLITLIMHAELDLCPITIRMTRQRVLERMSGGQSTMLALIDVIEQH